ncbi:MAG: permease-like cell division protein FtsX [Rikenellaceae bacterium]|jgi:cell division transport system permease protein|nr:permease-like cell division protein FtsX [Rikenellaceae bacterium]
MAQESNRRIRRRVRSSYLVSTVSIALVVFMMGSVGYLALNGLAATGRLQERFTLTVMLAPGAGVETVGKALKADPSVRELLFVPREQAAADYRNFMNRDFISFLDENPLPDSYDVKLNPGHYDKASVEEFEHRAMAMEGVGEVVYQRGVLDQMGRSFNKFNIVLTAFAAMLLLISLVLLNNTIKATIFAKRYTVSTMKLVGATNGFIRRPFLLSAMLQGVVAGVVAGAMFVGLVAGVEEGLPEIAIIRGEMPLAAITGAIILSAILISLIFTSFAVSKFLRMHINNIHLY